MDYFDDLDQEALNAFSELNDRMPESLATCSYDINSAAKHCLFERHQQDHHRKKAHPRGIKYLFKMNSPITPAVLSSAAVLSSQPQIAEGNGEDGTVQFCLIEERDVSNVKSWLTTVYPTFRPVFAPVNKAHKELSPSSPYPTLGVDTTMPQTRPQSLTGSLISPAQNQYPVWYFFYGTLANSAFLAELFGLMDCVPVLHQATICNGKLQTWAKKYEALVDSPGSWVDGWAYEVLSQEQEDVLLAYETAKYEVVRVSIIFKENLRHGQVVQGCTFRFAGEDNELDNL